ncbi:MAG: hypothetical protein ABI969_07370 [bacterium]
MATGPAILSAGETKKLAGSKSEITFRDGGAASLAQFNALSHSLGYGPVEDDPPESRGAGGRLIRRAVHDRNGWHGRFWTWRAFA